MSWQQVKEESRWAVAFRRFPPLTRLPRRWPPRVSTLDLEQLRHGPDWPPPLAEAEETNQEGLRSMVRPPWPGPGGPPP